MWGHILSPVVLRWVIQRSVIPTISEGINTKKNKRKQAITPKEVLTTVGFVCTGWAGSVIVSRTHFLSYHYLLIVAVPLLREKKLGYYTSKCILLS
jgi:hypothetical protein